MKRKKKTIKIAVDIGGVLGPKLSERLKKDGTYDVMAPPFSDAYARLKMWAWEDGVEVFIISRACSGEKIAANWAWLWQHFRDILPLAAENIHIYDGERSHKAELVKQLGIDVVIDDRIEVLVNMPPETRLFAFNPDPTEVETFKDLVGGRVTAVMSFGEIHRMLFNDTSFFDDLD